MRRSKNVDQSKEKICTNCLDKIKEQKITDEGETTFLSINKIAKSISKEIKKDCKELSKAKISISDLVHYRPECWLKKAKVIGKPGQGNPWTIQ